MSMKYLLSNMGSFLGGFAVNFLVNPFCYLFIVFGILSRRFHKRWLKVLFVLLSVIGIPCILLTAAITFFDVYFYPLLEGPLYLWVYPGLFRAGFFYLFAS